MREELTKGETRSAGQQIVDVDCAGCGEEDRHGAQDDGQDEVEQKDSERCKEAKLEGCACADPDFSDVAPYELLTC